MAKTDQRDQMGLGALAAILAGGIGYVLLGTIWGWTQGESLAYFHREVFLGSPLFKDRILSLCTLAMVPVFHTAYRRKLDRFARGSMLIMVLLVLAIVAIQMQAE